MNKLAKVANQVLRAHDPKARGSKNPLTTTHCWFVGNPAITDLSEPETGGFASPPYHGVALWRWSAVNSNRICACKCRLQHGKSLLQGLKKRRFTVPRAPCGAVLPPAAQTTRAAARSCRQARAETF